jgi:hypothetical protein
MSSCCASFIRVFSLIIFVLGDTNCLQSNNEGDHSEGFEVAMQNNTVFDFLFADELLFKRQQPCHTEE